MDKIIAVLMITIGIILLTVGVGMFIKAVCNIYFNFHKSSCNECANIFQEVNTDFPMPNCKPFRKELTGLNINPDPSYPRPPLPIPPPPPRDVRGRCKKEPCCECERPLSKYFDED